KNRRANHVRMQAHESGQQVCAVGVPNKGRPIQIDIISGGGTFNESLECLRFKLNIGLIKLFQVEATKPALDTFFRAASTQAEKGCAWCSLASERHQVVFVSASAMQKHQCTAIRVIRLVYPMNKREIAIDDTLLSRQGELWHPCPDGIRLFFIARRHEQELAQLFNRLVYCESRCIGCKFEQRSTRLANIERREI